MERFQFEWSKTFFSLIGGWLEKSTVESQRIIEMAQRRGRKRQQKITLPKVYLPPVHDRLTADLTRKTVARPDVIIDPYPEGNKDFDPEARYVPAFRGGALAVMGGAGEWLVPEKPQLKLWREARQDALGRLKVYGHIDGAMYTAGRHWQTLHERTAIGSVQAVDTTRTPVQGGRFPEMVTDSQIDASKKLAEADAALWRSAKPPLGSDRVAVIRDVLGGGMSIADSAAVRMVDRRSAGREFRAALEVLAVEFGFAQRKIFQNKKLA